MSWTEEWRNFLNSPRSPAEVIGGLWKRLKSITTAFGHLSQLSTWSGAPPEDSSSRPVRSDDLLPINPAEVPRVLREFEGKISEATCTMVTALNDMAYTSSQGGWNGYLLEGSLTGAQKGTVEHLARSLGYLEDTGVLCPRFDEVDAHLKTVRFDYQGEPVLAMEDIVADKVLEAWPAVGQAAVQDALVFLPEHLRKKMLNPESCLKLTHEWPSEPHHSKVRASDEEWNKLVKAGYDRQLMVGVDPEDVFKDHAGRPVLNGAGAVKKEKKKDGKVLRLQRFISNLIPTNMFQDRIEGDDKLLPYLGQLTLLEQEQGEVWLVDSEDFVSCFNLFRLPPCWRKYMAFNKLVDASLMGGPAGKKVYPAMNVLPMGWVSSVAIIQAIVRTLVFDEAEVPLSSEVAKTKNLPADDDLTVIYLDSFDQLRKLREGCHEVLTNQISDRHVRFLAVCKKFGLPLNEGKRLVGATRGSLQGGELDGLQGRYGLAHEKMAEIIGLGAALLGQEKWTEASLRHFVGKATFGCCFRRPLFAVMEHLFEEIRKREEGQDKAPPSNAAWDEVAMLVSLVPLMYTNLKALVDHEVSVTDASPSGGGAAVATEFMEEPCYIRRDPGYCVECDRAVPEGDRYPCPALCGATMCGLACVLRHRDRGTSCPRKDWRMPKFGERFAGIRAPLSHAVAMKGKIEVQPPFDWHFGDDFFSEEGRKTLQDLCDDPCLAFEHWAPECKLFSRARGKPITLRSGKTITGPKPLRDGKHVMGFPWLSRDEKARVRKSNNMVLKALKRGKENRRGLKKYWTCEHPRRSWMWEFKLVKELEELPGFNYAVGSHCCFGGQREKWFAFFGDLPTLRAWLDRECRGHTGLLSYEVEERPDGTLHFPTEEEAEYPWQLCRAYAEAVAEQVKADGHFEDGVVEAREVHYLDELAGATARLAAVEVATPMATLLALAEMDMVPGKERSHLSQLLRAATYRGTDVRLMVEIDGPGGSQLHEQPYLAMRWKWKTVIAYPWKQEAHINELELLAVAVFLRRRARSKSRQHTRFFHILDSMVTRGVLAKGRSSSWRLNRVARRCSAYLLAMDDYMFPLWTISRWNFADTPSRAHE